MFAEVELPEEAHGEAARFGVHPALLDAALHAGALGDLLPEAEAGRAYLPFSWSGVSLYATGARSLRVKVGRRAVGAAGEGAANGGSAITLVIAGADGAPIAEIDALTLRPLNVGDLTATTAGGALHRLEWTALPAGAATRPSRWAVLGGDDLGTGAPNFPDLATLAALDASTGVPEAVLAVCPSSSPAPDVAVHETTAAVLDLLQGWSAE
ncbi:polyketide synthase dehydratase domain-containing protein, partial [Sphaerisporangium melleum]|uniref:polyketide synthase dehydratase domain-containing protein n=1 Tax=Sphaerisporangium melleum TaxID=321316 RepID=UPI0027DEA8A3